MAGKKVVIVGEMYDPGLGIWGGPGPEQPPGGGEPPLGIWGGGNVPYPTPPIYIPVPPPPDSGLKPEHPIYIPVYPSHPIVIPVPPDGGEPNPPVVWPPLPGGVPPVGGYPGFPAPPLGLWGPNDPRPTPPIYIPAPMPPEPPEGGGDEHPAHPIYIPVYPAHPIVLPPDGETPKPPPGMVNPPTGLPGFWSFSPYYDCYVFVPYAGSGVGPNP